MEIVPAADQEQHWVAVLGPGQVQHEPCAAACGRQRVPAAAAAAAATAAAAEAATAAAAEAATAAAADAVEAAVVGVDAVGM